MAQLIMDIAKDVFEGLRPMRENIHMFSNKLVSQLMAFLNSVSGILSFYQTYPSRNENNEVVYEFRYSVDDQHSGVVNDRWEQRVGQFVKGSYSLLEPSGMIRTVNYEVDGRRGFVAVVRTHYPATSLQSIQQLQRSNQMFPEPEVNLRRAAPPPPSSRRAAPPPPSSRRDAASRPLSPHQGFQSGFQGGGSPNYQQLPPAPF